MVNGCRAGWLALCVLAGMIAALALAESSPPSKGQTFSIPRESIDGGAQTASSPTYSVTGAVGQPDAAPPGTSPSFQARGGFFAPPATVRPNLIFEDGFES